MSVLVSGGPSLGYEPAVWLGAPAPGGLALPSAMPAADTLYAPRGVWIGDGEPFGGVVVADSGNHRILIWRSMPTSDQSPADVVLGQSGFGDEGPGLLHLPTGVAVFDGRLVVADAWHHRLLVWDGVPEESGVGPDVVIGQDGLGGVEPNRGSGAAVRDGFYWPYGFGFAGGRFFVADTGNRRVLGWPGFPEAGEPPRWLIGQDDWVSRGENADGAVGPLTFRWPHAIAGDDRGGLYVADAGNHRVLGWRDAGAACDGGEPDVVYGQADLVSNGEWPYGPQAADVHRFPYGLAMGDGLLVVGDTANNRVLLHECGGGVPGRDADGVLAQPDFASNGENRWDAVERDTLCWPYGVDVRGGLIGVADSGNNRVMIWKRRVPRED